jgi:hypothetical protein
MDMWSVLYFKKETLYDWLRVYVMEDGVKHRPQQEGAEEQEV